MFDLKKSYITICSALIYFFVFFSKCIKIHVILLLMTFNWVLNFLKNSIVLGLVLTFWYLFFFINIIDFLLTMN